MVDLCMTLCIPVVMVMGGRTSQASELGEGVILCICPIFGSWMSQKTCVK